MLNNSKIEHLEDIKKIRKIEKEVLLSSGIPVNDISHWNAGSEYNRGIMSIFDANASYNISNYHYSYEINYTIKEKYLSTIMSKKASMECVFMPNATAAICCLANYIKIKNYKKICIVEPSYFSVYACLKSFGINVYKESVNIDQHRVLLPIDRIKHKKYDVVWITSPVFSTGIYYSSNQIEIISSLTRQGILVIIDESASSPNHTILNEIVYNKNIISIFSPHKYIATNSIKFALVICSNPISDFLEDWIDVFIGSLPISSCIAIDHYLSKNFNLCLNYHDQFIKNNIELIKKLCIQYPNNEFIASESNYITVCNTVVPSIVSLSQINMRKIINETKVSFIPGYINGFNQAWGFCYRVGLLQNASDLISSLGRLFDYFNV